jgi:Spy/CpxP family protein refolding chaperone
MKKTAITTLMLGLMTYGVTAMAAPGADTGYGSNAYGPAEERLAAPCFPRKGYDDRKMGFRMYERLDLTEQQRTSFRELRRKHFDRSINDRRHLGDLQRELVKESLRKNRDQRKIDAMANDIGRGHAALAQSRSRFLHELSAILTPEQLQKFHDMKQMRSRGV